MKKQSFHSATSGQENSKRKKVLLPLVFSVVALIVVGIVLYSVTASFRSAAASSGLTDEAQIPILSEVSSSPTPETAQPSGTGVLDTYPQAGDKLGHLTISGTAVDCDVYYGDSETEFSKGAGTFRGARIPGEGGTILMGGHTGTYFRDFESVEVGDDVTFTTSYGEYHYVVTDTRVALDTDTTAYDLEADNENLIMYTCYPFGIVNPTDERFFVYCDYVSGPTLQVGQS